MRYTCTSLLKRAPLPPRRKTALKAKQEKRGKEKAIHDSSSDDEVDDASLTHGEKNRQDAQKTKQEWCQV